MILVYLKTETYHFTNSDLEEYVTICYHINLKSLPEQISIRICSFQDMEWYLNSLSAVRLYPEMSFGFLPYELWEEHVIKNNGPETIKVLIPIVNFEQQSIDVETYMWNFASKNE